MLRSTRRLTTALLWLAIVLLPLRGLAATLMPIGMLGQTQRAPAVEAPNALASAMPCHGNIGNIGAATPADATPAQHNCALCDLCHSSVAQAPTRAGLDAAARQAKPRAGAPTSIEPRLPDGVFRPPRNTFA